jgi:hypothetical protein
MRKPIQRPSKLWRPSRLWPAIGYVPAKDTSIAALRLARCEGQQLVYVGKAGTGKLRQFQMRQVVLHDTPPESRIIRPELRETKWK